MARTKVIIWVRLCVRYDAESLHDQVVACAFAWWKAQRNYIGHHLALPSNFCFVTARSNEQNRQDTSKVEWDLTYATSEAWNETTRHL